MANWKHGGIVTCSSAGTPVQFTTTHTIVHSISIQAMPFNTNRVVIGSDNTVRAGDGSSTNPSGTILAILGAGSATGTPPTAGGKVTEQPFAIDVSQFWLDAVTNDEGVYWSYLEG